LTLGHYLPVTHPEFLVEKISTRFSARNRWWVTRESARGRGVAPDFREKTLPPDYGWDFLKKSSDLEVTTIIWDRKS